jgi:ABC-type multidrug transport system permease subunit
VILFVLFGISGTQAIWAQEFSNVSRMEQSLENMSSQMEEVVERLTMMNDRFGALKQVQEITVYLLVIVFMMGLAFVIFGFYIGQEHKLSLFTKRLYLVSFLALVIPVTIIIIRYMANTLLSGGINDPILPVAFILLIPVATSYILMIVKYRHEAPRSQ